MLVRSSGDVRREVEDAGEKFREFQKGTQG